jgi:hypothetical protein
VLAPLLFVAGIVLVVAAIAALAGPWWAVLTLGLILAALGVLTAAWDRQHPAPAPADSKAGESP